MTTLASSLFVLRSVMPENVFIGLDDKPRLGHLHTMVDQHADRPKSRVSMLDYMAPELFSVRAADEVELSLLQGDSDEEGDEKLVQHHQNQQQLQQRLSQRHRSQYGEEQRKQQGADGVHAGPALQAEQQQQQCGLEGDRCSLGSSSLRARAGLEEVQLPGTCCSRGSSTGVSLGAQHSRSSHACGSQKNSFELPAPHWDGKFLNGSLPGSSQDAIQSQLQQQYCKAVWEQTDYYDEKVDIWQVGCLVHEILCGNLPFEVRKVEVMLYQ